MGWVKARGVWAPPRRDTGSRTRSSTGRGGRRHLQIEPLERRQLLSLAPLGLDNEALLDRGGPPERPHPLPWAPGGLDKEALWEREGPGAGGEAAVVHDPWYYALQRATD